MHYIKIVFGKIKIKFTLDYIMLMLMVLSLNKSFYMDAGQTTRFRFAVSIVLFVYICIRGWINNISFVKYIGLYILSVLLSAVVNYKSFNMVGIITTSFLLIDIYIFLPSFGKKYGFDTLINVLFWVLLFSLLLTDIPILTGSIKRSEQEVYFWGSKFAVSYIHMLFIAVYYCKKEQNTINIKLFKSSTSLKSILWILLNIYSVFLCLIINCGTGVIGVAFILLLILIKRLLKSNLVKPMLYVMVFIISNYIVLNTSFITTVEVFTDFITNFLNKDLTLTGRVKIYQNLWSIISKKTLLGYGTSSDIVSQVVGYGNAQNGLMNIWVKMGLIGVIAFVLCLFFSLNDAKKRHIIPAFSLLAFIYAMTICSTVEICLSYIFFFGVALFITNVYCEYNHLAGDNHEQQRVLKPIA